ncbi:hypothetical protein [Actinoallomurus iriomotensis]|uniref:Lipopolysaccharide assembly protein A domain-containing protein n=1 Tax=Actinoallomurus iriomotensis TaxID=478107 RepID=A0A9W6RF73_9ACTN|nr:hypothetical protein [Actinoallomurus iriomotensis]GLY74474.1 hypothetical protein Airi01_027410 [Actinoallomurus iriomotensis]
MVFVGVVVAVAAVVVGIEVIVHNSSSASLGFFGYHVPGVHTEAQVFAAGLIVAFVAGGGLAMAWISLLRKARVRRELHDLREEREETMASLERKNQQLERELARVRGGATSAPVTGEVPVASGRRRDREPVSPFFDNPA